MLTSSLLTELLCSLSIIGGLLLLGTFLRAKVKLFQKLFLPASVIGGFIGLLLGPMVLGDYAILRVSETYINDWSLLPGTLIVPIFAAVPLGMFMNRSPKAESGKKTAPNVLKAFALFAALSFMQSAIGFGTNLFFSSTGDYDLYRTFGYELSQGFCGGHGTAGAVGKIFEGLGLDYWATAQGVAVTTATIGIIGGMLLGIIFINIAAAKGKTAVLKKPGDIPAEMSRGYVADTSRHTSMGRETFMPSTIETISLHLAIILGVCGAAYGLLGLLAKTGISAFSSMPVWIYAMVIMFGVNHLIIKLGLDWAIDTKVKSRISGAMSDFAITAAIASLPVEAVMEYAVPILVMCAIGFVLTYIFVFKLGDIVYKGDYAFERSIIAWGTATGVMITGMMLLKICDPDYETPALADFSMGFSLLSLSGLITTPLTLAVIASGSTMANFLFSLAVTGVFWAILAVVTVGSRVSARRTAPAAETATLAD